MYTKRNRPEKHLGPSPCADAKRKRRMRKPWLLLIVLSALCTGLFGCGRIQEEETTDKPVVYASFFPIYDLVRQVAGDTVELKSFMPSSADPHLWEPSAKDLRALSRADILFINGANMEPWEDKIRESLPDVRVVNLAAKVDLISYKGAADLGDFQYMARMRGKAKERYKFEFGHTHEDAMRVCFLKGDKRTDEEKRIEKAKKYMMDPGERVAQEETIPVEAGKVYALEMGHQSGRVYFTLPTDGDWYVISDRISEDILSYEIQKGDQKMPVEDIVTHSTSMKDKITYDPHAWLSVPNGKAYLTTIRDNLIELYPEHKKAYEKAVFRAQDALAALHARYVEKFKTIKKSDREFVVTHYAWEYLAQDYGLKQFPLQNLVSQESPGLETIKRAIRYAREQKIRTIFYEDYMPPKVAEIITEEVDGEAVPLRSMEYVKGADNEAPGAYTRIMEENLEALYRSMEGGRS